MGTFRIDWPAIQLLIITIIAFALGLAGCGQVGDSFALPGPFGVPSELAPFQGRWKFDAAQTRQSEGAEDEDLTAEEQALLKAFQQLGIGMTDIEVRGARITQQGGLLQSQYDLLDYKKEGNKVVGKALWHEDRHDPGDASEVKYSLERKDKTLIFTCEDEEDGVAKEFYFHPL